LLHRITNLTEKRICRFMAALEVPIERFDDLLLSLRMDANDPPLHLANLARSGSSTSSHE